MSDDPTLHGDPSARLSAAFAAVAARMQGLDCVNRELAVEAVGFAPWEGHWLGVMVTPWFMNLALLPREADRWQPLRPGEKRSYRFPAGVYEFIGATDPGIGDFQMCSLFSPMQEFADQASARAVAQLAREALLDARNAEPEVRPPAGAPAPHALAQLRDGGAAPMSKRDFLRARGLGRGTAEKREGSA